MKAIKRDLQERFDRFVEDVKAVVHAHSDKTAGDLFMDSAVADDLRHFAFVAGGAVVSAVRGEEPNDLDVFFTNPDACARVVRALLEIMCRGGTAPKVEIFGDRVTLSEGVTRSGVEVLDDGQEVIRVADNPRPGTPILATRNALTLAGGYQLVLVKTGPAEQVMETFDWRHCRMAYEPSPAAGLPVGNLILDPAAVLCATRRVLEFCGSAYPLASLLRMRKYVERGWTAGAGEVLKMALALAGARLDLPANLQTQLWGVDIGAYLGILEAMEKDSGMGIRELNNVLDADRSGPAWRSI